MSRIRLTEKIASIIDQINGRLDRKALFDEKEIAIMKKLLPLVKDLEKLLKDEHHRPLDKGSIQKALDKCVEIIKEKDPFPPTVFFGRNLIRLQKTIFDPPTKTELEGVEDGEDYIPKTSQTWHMALQMIDYIEKFIR